MANVSNHEGSGAVSQNDPFSFLKLIAEVSTIIVGLSFVAGWSYLASYYRTFGVNPIELDIPIPVASTLALHMLYNSGWPLPTAAAVIAVLAAAGHYFARVRVTYRWWVVAGLILLIFLSATASLIRGRHNANWDMFEEHPNLPIVAFSAKPKAAPAKSNSAASELDLAEQPSCVGYEDFGTMDCKLLLHSGGRYYYFRPVSKESAGKTVNLDLYVIPDSEVLGIHIQRGIDLTGIDR